MTRPGGEVFGVLGPNGAGNSRTIPGGRLDAVQAGPSSARVNRAKSALSVARCSRWKPSPVPVTAIVGDGGGGDGCVEFVSLIHTSYTADAGYTSLTEWLLAASSWSHIASTLNG